MSRKGAGGGPSADDAEGQLRLGDHHALLEHVVDPVWSLDGDLRLIAFNQAFADLAGLQRRPLPGVSVLDCHVPGSQAEWRTVYARGLAGDTVRHEWVSGVGEGALSFDIFVTPMVVNGQPRGLAVCARETTERRRAAALLARSKDAAEAASQAKSDFLAHISHEIRTPLNAIIGMTELTLDTELTVRQRRLLQTVRMNTEALLYLITDILDFSKIEAGQMDLESAPCSIVDVVEEVVEFLAVSASRKGLRLLCDVTPGAAVEVMGDVHRLRQIVMNLLSNAIKYTQQGEVVVRLRFRPRDDDASGHEMVLAIIDTGVGISTRDQGLIFSKFYRAAHNPTGRVSGTGLGLSITRSLVLLMGGKIELRSEVGRGSMFRVRIPMACTVAPSAFEGRLAGLAVIVADPHPIARAWMVEASKESGAKVASATSAAEVKQLLDAGFSPDAVVVDQDLDDPEGAAAMVQVRASRRGVRRILCVDPTRSFAGGEGTFEAMLVRPPRLAALIAAVDGSAGSTMRWPTSTLDESLSAPTTPTRGKARAPQPPDGVRLHRGADVLVVEDSADNQQVALAILESAGHRVVVAHDGRDGVLKARTQAFDVILMDVHMPVMDGIEATAHIRSDEVMLQRGRRAIVAFTAHATDAVRQRCVRAGMDDFLTKPVSRDRLLGVVERWVRLVPTILVADDDPDNRALMRERLVAAGAEVLVATNGEEVIRAVRQNPIDLVVLDMEMPVMDGFQAARVLRSFPQHMGLPILAVTGHSGQAAKARCLAAGCTAYLAKPIIKMDFIEAVSACLRTSVSGEPLAAVTSETPLPNVDPDIADLVPTYIQNRRKDVEAMRLALERGVLSEIGRMGHSMKGSGTPYGFPEISRLGGQLEEAVAAGDIAGLGVLVTLVGRSLDR